MMPRCAALALGLGLLAGCALPNNGLDAIEDRAPDAGGAPALDASALDASALDASALDVGAPIEAGSGSYADAPAIPEAGSDPGDADSSVGHALEFAGGAYVAVGQVPIPADFTLEAWVMPTHISGETSIVAEDRDLQPAGQFRLGLVASGQLFFVMSDATGNTAGLFTGIGFALQSPAALPLGAWTHVAVTKSKGSFALFVNGAQAAQFNPAGLALTYGGPAVPLRIAARVGFDGTSANEAFTGTIDEVRFWNVARTGADIAANMAHTVSPSDPGLLAYWRFDDGTGTIASDEENLYPGTLVAGPVWVAQTAF
jgi:hypothetical protein